MGAEDGFITYLVERGDYAPRTIRFYREQCRLILKILAEVAPTATPETLTEQELRALVFFLRSKYAVSTQKDYLIALKRMCDYSNNPVFSRYRVKFQTDTRPRVDWLTAEDAQHLIDLRKTPLQELIISLELLHGLRRCEVLRLTLDDLHGDYLTIRGKGRAGGKLRTVPYHRDFKKSLSRWLNERSEITARAASGAEDPRTVLVYCRAGVIRSYEQIKGKAIDKNINELKNRTGLNFCNHTLRRTFGRELYRSGADLTVIATIYGHTSTVQTMKYLGLNLDDMRDAMVKMSLGSE